MMSALCGSPVSVALLAAMWCCPASAWAQQPAAAEDDPQFAEAVETYDNGNVEKYVALGWLEKGQAALDSHAEPWDNRGDYNTAVKWAKLAAKAVADRPYADIYFHILSEHVRICNHAGRPNEGKESLDRLLQFDSLDSIRRNYVSLLALYGKLVRTALPDGSLDRGLLAAAYPDLLTKMDTVEQAILHLNAPEQADQYLFEAWQRLQISWTSLYSSSVLAIAAGLKRNGGKEWKKGEGVHARKLLQRVWFIDENRFPSVAAAFYLKAYRFYQLFGDVTEILQSLTRARRLFAQAQDRNGLARADLAEADAILATGSTVDAMGVSAASPSGEFEQSGMALELIPPRPESVWQRRADQSRMVLMKAEVVFRNTKSRRGLAATYLRKGYLQSRLGRYDDASHLYGQARSVSTLAGDEPGRLLAMFHFMVNQIRANRIGLVQLTAQELLESLEKGDYKGLALGMGNTLLGLARRDLSRFATPGQQTAALKLSVQCYLLTANRRFIARHVADVAQIAAGLHLYDLTGRYAQKALTLLDQELQGQVQSWEKEGLLMVKAIVAHSAANSFLSSPAFRKESLQYARMAVDYAKGTKLQGSEEAETFQSTLLLACLHNREFAMARKLVAKNDDDRLFSIAMQAGDFKTAVTLAAGPCTKARRLALEAGAAAEGEEPVPPEVLEEAQRKLAFRVRRLAGAMIRLALAKKRKRPKSVPPEFASARNLVDEWKELISGEFDFNEEPWELLALHGQVAAGRNEPVAAWMFFSGALQAIAARLQTTRSVESRAEFMSSIYDLLQSIITFLAAHKDTEFDVPGKGKLTGAAAALAVVHELESLRLADMLAGGSEYQTGLLAPTEASALLIGEGRIKNATLELAELESRGAPDPSELKAAREELAAAREELAGARLLLDQKYPRFAFARGTPGDFSPSRFVELAKERKTTIVVYYLAEPDSYAWLVDAAGIRVHVLSVSARHIESLVGKLLDSMSGRTGKGGKGFNNAVAQKLYKALLEPLDAELPVATTIAIVPDGVLFSLPFGVLKTRNSYFIERNPFFIAPSLTALSHLAGRKQPEEAQNKLLILADPVFGVEGTAGGEDSSSSLKSGLLSLQMMPAAPSSSTPVEDLVDLFGKRNVAASLGRDATELVFKKVGGEYSILHLACPVVTNPADPAYSGLVLAPAASPEEDDFLHASEVSIVPLKARLAVVAAYETGLGRMTQKEGLAGLIKGFHTAGVPTVVATLTPTDAGAAAPFLTAFYEAVKRGEPIHRAVQEAALKLQGQPGSADPAFWGGYVVYGLGDQKLEP